MRALVRTSSKQGRLNLARKKYHFKAFMLPRFKDRGSKSKAAAVKPLISKHGVSLSLRNTRTYRAHMGVSPERYFSCKCHKLAAAYSAVLKRKCTPFFSSALCNRRPQREALLMGRFSRQHQEPALF